MSIIRSIIKREKGLKFMQDYDIALLRLKCFRNDVYKGIAPNINATDFNPEPPILACQFCSTAGFEEIIALANEDGKFALQNTKMKKQSEPQLTGTQAHCDAIFDIAWMPQELKLITGSGDHSARLWDVSYSTITELQSFQAHTRSIKSVMFRPQDKAVFATGARDGAIMVWDIRASYSNKPKPDNCIHNAHYKHLPSKKRQLRSPSYISKQNQAQGITSLVFQDDYTLFSCSAGDGLIKIWDLRKNYSIHKKDPIAKCIITYGGKSNSNGFTSLLICPSRITLYASCMDNTIYAYNISSYNSKPIAKYYGHKISTFYVKACLSPDGKYLASGSSDEMAYIWNTKNPGFPLLKLSGHCEEVSCIAWSNVGETKIVTGSDYSHHRIWRVGKDYVDKDEKINICGYAEPLYALVTKQNKKCTLETTPKICKLQNTIGDPSESDVTAVNSVFSNLKNTSQGNYECIKRSFAEISNDYHLEGKNKRKLSAIQENLDAETKLVNTANREKPRQVSSTIRIARYQNNSMETDLPSSYQCYELASNLITESDTNTSFSPTINLPNFVIDGTAPHLLEMSPQKLRENIDWLTKIRKQKNTQQIGKTVDKINSPKRRNIQVHKTIRSKNIETRNTPKNRPGSLLEFFRPEIKDCNNDLHLDSISLKTPCSSKTI